MVSALRQERRKDAEERLAQGKNPWDVANKILKKDKSSEIPLVDGRQIQSDKEKCERMNDFFIQKVKNLQNRLSKETAEDPLKRLREKLREEKLNFEFRQLSVIEVEKIIQ